MRETVGLYETAKDRSILSGLMAFCLLLAAIWLSAFLLPNPYDAEGSIDAFIYRAYSLNFGQLINRYGPFYFSYRSVPLLSVRFAEAVFGNSLMNKGLIAIQASLVATALWSVIRPNLSAVQSAALCVIICVSPWFLRTAATTYIEGSVVVLMFALIATLMQLARSDFQSWAWAAASGVVLSLIFNSNAYLVVYGVLIFLGFFAAGLEQDRVRTLLIAGVVAVLGFLVTQLACWLVWASILRFGYGTPWSTMIAWTKIAAVGGSHDTDLFGIAVGRSHGGGLLATPQPDMMRMISEGQVHVVFPLVAILSCLIYRIWNSQGRREFTEFRDLQRISEWNMALTAAVLVGSFAYATSESMGNQMIRLTYYFSYLMPVAAVSVCYTMTDLRGSKDGEMVTPALLAAAFFTLTIHLAFSLVPGLASAAYPGRWFAKVMALAVLFCGLVLIVPAFRAGVAIVALGAMVALGVPLFNVSGTNIYSSVYSFETGRVSRDIIRGQKALIDFTEANAPAPGVHPSGRPVLFWHPNSQYTVSLQAAYLSDYQSLHRHHDGPALPVLNDTAIGQLKAGYRPEIVFICEDAAQCEAAHKAFRDLGVGYGVVAKGGYSGQTRSVIFEYIRIHTKPA
jgi:hypothetical protein